MYMSIVCGICLPKMGLNQNDLIGRNGKSEFFFRIRLLSFAAFILVQIINLSIWKIIIY